MANLDSRVMELESANRKPGQSITRAQWQQLTPGDKKARHLSILSMLPIAEDQDDEGLFYLADLYRWDRTRWGSDDRPSDTDRGNAPGRPGAHAM
jgi:hypothetical protein